MSVTHRGAPALLVLLLAGCGPGRDPVGTPVSWWHNLQGGAIAQQRPPPPGLDAPYPLVGTTPPRPVITSEAARDALTASLIDQQSASHQLDARNPIIVTAAPAPSKPATPGTGQAPAAAPPSSATLDAAGTTPTPARTPAPASAPTSAQRNADEPILAMPPPPPGTTVVVASGPLPQMAARPPTPPNFPGFDIPATTVPPIEPQLAGRTAVLPNIDFQPGSDVLLPSDQSTLHRIAAARGASPIRIDAGGDARSDLPDAQAAALRLALARAASASHALEAFGVPPASIEVAANAFGRGATIAVVH